MIYSSRALALVLSFSVSVITAIFLSFFDSITGKILIVSSLVIFSISFSLVFILLEYVIFRQIEEVGKLISRLKRKEIDQGANHRTSVLKPLRGIANDVFSLAESKQQEIDQLKKLEAFRKEFIADVSHELKTPIFAAQGFVHTLLDGAVNDKGVRIKFLRKAAKSLDGLDSLVQDLLTLSHIETGQIKMHFESFDMYELAEEVFEQFENKSDKKEIALRIESENRRVFVYADRQRIAQVMTNLISNAIKHSTDPGEVIVRFQTGKKSVHVSVEDSGEGIPAEHLPRIFERFYRVDKSRSREKGGTGLGLAIVKHILDGHNTRAEVESDVGKGSVFSFKLPRKKHEKDGSE